MSNAIIGAAPFTFGFNEGFPTNPLDISILNIFSLPSEYSRPNNIKNDRLINLVNLLPNNYSGTQVEEFIKFFEDFLNFELYKHKLDPNIVTADISILKKIELLSSLREPDVIDSELLQFLATYLGYDINFSKGDIFSADNPVETNDYLRETIRSLPSWYKLKSTDSAISMLMYMFGIVSDVQTLWTDDYENNWIIENTEAHSIEYETVTEEVPVISIERDIPENYYPTPHFHVTIDVNKSPVDFEDNLKNIISLIKSIKPVNTVFEGFKSSSTFSNALINISTSPVMTNRIDIIEDYVTP